MDNFVRSKRISVRPVMAGFPVWPKRFWVGMGVELIKEIQHRDFRCAGGVISYGLIHI